jgi:hypothetical protein
MKELNQPKTTLEPNENDHGSKQRERAVESTQGMLHRLIGRFTLNGVGSTDEQSLQHRNKSTG